MRALDMLTGPVVRLLACLLLPAAWPGGLYAGDDLAPATGRFLVAQRGLSGPHFRHSVVYLVEHDAHGSLGVIVNRPTHSSIADLLPGIRDSAIGTYRVFSGGPVNTHLMLMLFRDDQRPELALHVAGDVYVSNQTALLQQLADAQKPENELRLYAGQAGWAPGQLAREIVQGSWYVVEDDPELVFAADPENLWHRLIDRVDPTGILVMRSLADDATGL
jgi:putative transcriptional regulator